MNLVKHMSSNTTDRACLAYTRQSAFGRRQSLPRVSYTSTMKHIMGCYHLHIERTQTVRKKSSVGNDRPLSLLSASFAPPPSSRRAPRRSHPSPPASMAPPVFFLSLFPVRHPYALFVSRTHPPPSLCTPVPVLDFFSNERLNQISRPSTTASPSCRRVQPSYRVHSLV